MRLKCKQLNLMVFIIVLIFGLGIFNQISAQQRTVQGTVTDNQGSPLPGVTVVVKGTTQGTVTNADGDYSLSNVPENASLVFSFVGMRTQEVVVGSQSSINIEMEIDAIGIEEVVAVGYGTMRKSDITGSVSSMKSEELEGRVISSLEQGMQGMLAGVHVNQASGQPGGRTIVRIRGQNSILGGNDPLYVIDGIPIQSGSDGNTSLLSSINPGDIATINILKDASATAIYGARGSNGVILIETKKGKSGQQMIRFDSYVGISEVVKKIEMMNSEQYVEITNERYRNDGLTEPFSNTDIGNVTSVNTNWQDETFQTALAQNYALSAQGGNEQTQYFISGNYLDEEGTIIGSDFTRGAFRLNLDQKMFERLNISSNMYVARSTGNRTATESTAGILRPTLGAPPISSPRDENGNYIPGAEVHSYPWTPDDDNPLILATERLNQLTINKIIGNLLARYEFTNDLSLQTKLGVDRNENSLDIYATRKNYGVPDGEGSKRVSESQYYLIENMINYNKVFPNGQHRIDVMGAFTWETEKSESILASSEGFVTDDFLNRNLGAGERYSSPSTGYSEWDILSFLGRINYSLKDRYLFTLNARRDGSSRFGEGNKWGFFPSAAIAWRLIEEDFIKQIDQISDLKLRFSWGNTGNQAISPYESMQRYSPTALVLGGTDRIGFAPNNIGNPNLKWETTEAFNIGLNLGLVDQRIYLNLDLYHKTTKNLLAQVNVPPSSGFTSTLQNIGSMQNKGIELDIFGNIINGTNFSWNTNFNFSINRNKVTELSRGADIIAPNISFVGSANIVREGEPLSSFYGLQEDGLTEDGLIKYKDQNDDGFINNEDRVIIGSPYPDFSYGFKTEIRYKNIDFSIFIQGDYGNQLFNANKYYLATSFFRGINQIADNINRWTLENPDPNAPYPKATTLLNVSWSDRFVEDASYLRFKDIRLGYNIPVNNLPIKTAYIYLSGQNLITLTNYSWHDPDVNAFSSGDLRVGIDQHSYPVSKTITFGINVAF